MAQKWEMGKASDADDRLHHMLCHGNLQKQISAKFIFSYRVARKDSKLLPKQRAQGAQGQSAVGSRARQQLATTATG